ncbi:MAG: GNAT family N-acetyltransferase [Schleiferiaceae bacterium]|jgi:ElaA protein|nr:GNAT family N-acetyltransferase [Flavobacteriales bacterium]MDE0791909.1 GNAT family N-acetyltransferase [Schleiferiaceae bacterium]MDO7565914.1 GNAT family N-acetyltransferase [Schleiferiaceae bacterium]MDO7583533.1 GNAT family N-acetyltransferase [Schleiferiaceae bacterium]MDO7592624.1 GNAT family N-acetyltransferase [Schleiferiaceae bacterium]|tara:strand:+ start:629 stop:1090 length:462 start_codon:yes stop_codon:yes gene_type:complete
MEWKCKAFKAINTEELYEILKLRAAVFVVEQDCPYLDLDDLDQRSHHVWTETPQGEVIAYSRMIPPGLHVNEASIGRVVTLPSRRGESLGKQVFQQALDHALLAWPEHDIVIMAQTYLVDFYEAFSFVVEREPFLEDGLPHRWMRRKAGNAEA